MAKIKIQNFGADEFNLRCPRCGCSEFKINSWDSGVHKYNHCERCGADVYAEPHMNGNTRCGTDIGMVIEKKFYNYTPVER